MSEQFSKSIHARITGCTEEYKTVIHDFPGYLKERGYSESTRHSYHSALTHFVCWLMQESANDRKIDRSTVSAFLQQHLPVCHCPPPIYKEPKTVRAALNPCLSQMQHFNVMFNDFHSFNVAKMTVNQWAYG